MGGWRFVLQSPDGAHRITASDREADMTRSRLELLAVIRGLEALDQPSHVTLITSSRYVRSGLRYGLEQWRQTNWQWDHFGVLSPIKNEDYWRRLDHALQFHRVECRIETGRDRTFPVESQLVPAETAVARPPVTPVTPRRRAEVEVASDPHWPRPRSRWSRAAMALGTAAAAVTAMVACRL